MNDKATKNLELEVSNFGPIREAAIDLRPLTVFIGPSNTGKSWLAILIYALHRYLDNEERGFAFRLHRPLRRYRGNGGKPSRDKMNAAFEWLRQEFDNDDREPDNARSFDIPDFILSEIQSEFDSQGDLIDFELCRCFGIDEIGKLIRKRSRGGARIVIRRHLTESSTSLEHRLTLKAKKAEFKVDVPEKMTIQQGLYRFNRYISRTLDTNSDSPPDGPDMRLWFSRLIEIMTSSAYPYLFSPLNVPAFYLPADRSGVMHAHSVVVSALIESATMAGLRQSERQPVLSGVLADFLERLIEPGRRFRPGKSPDYGAGIEKTILGGSVRIDRSEITNYPRFAYRPDGWEDDLPLANASSMVEELAPVVLYLRHWVMPGNVLIVEEPESHLHPAMQVELTRQLASLIASGIRVIITTHSEWVLEELANIVQRSGLPKKQRKGLSGEDVTLSPHQVGAWLFKKKPDTRTKKKSTVESSVVEEIKLDSETGMYPSDFDAVSEALYNENASIFNRMQDNR